MVIPAPQAGGSAIGHVLLCMIVRGSSGKASPRRRGLPLLVGRAGSVGVDLPAAWACRRRHVPVSGCS